VPKFLKHLIAGEIRGYYDGIHNLPIFTKTPLLQQEYFPLYNGIQKVHFKNSDKYIYLRAGRKHELEKFECIFNIHKICSNCILYYIHICLYGTFAYNCYKFGLKEAKIKYFFLNIFNFFYI
jgi:hypothetical protein